MTRGTPATRTCTHKRTRARVGTHTDTEATPRSQSKVCPGAAPHPLPPAPSSLPAGAGPSPLLSPPPPLGPPGPDTVSVTAAVPFISAAPAPPRPDGAGREGGSDAEVALPPPPRAPPPPPVGRRARRLRQEEAPRRALSAEAAGGAVPATFSPARGRGGKWGGHLPARSIPPPPALPPGAVSSPAPRPSRCRRAEPSRARSRGRSGGQRPGGCAAWAAPAPSPGTPPPPARLPPAILTRSRRGGGNFARRRNAGGLRSPPRLLAPGVSPGPGGMEGGRVSWGAVPGAVGTRASVFRPIPAVRRVGARVPGTSVSCGRRGTSAPRGRADGRAGVSGCREQPRGVHGIFPSSLLLLLLSPPPPPSSSSSPRCSARSPSRGGPAAAADAALP